MVFDFSSQANDSVLVRTGFDGSSEFLRFVPALYWRAAGLALSPWIAWGARVGDVK